MPSGNSRKEGVQGPARRSGPYQPSESLSITSRRPRTCSHSSQPGPFGSTVQPYLRSKAFAFVLFSVNCARWSSRCSMSSIQPPQRHGPGYSGRVAQPCRKCRKPSGRRSRPPFDTFVTPAWGPGPAETVALPRSDHAQEVEERPGRAVPIVAKARGVTETGPSGTFGTFGTDPRPFIDTRSVTGGSGLASSAIPCRFDLPPNPGPGCGEQVILPVGACLPSREPDDPRWLSPRLTATTSDPGWDHPAFDLTLSHPAA
jgi:hypothetical protein